MPRAPGRARSAAPSGRATQPQQGRDTDDDGRCPDRGDGRDRGDEHRGAVGADQGDEAPDPEEAARPTGGAASAPSVMTMPEPRPLAIDIATTATRRLLACPPRAAP